MTIETSARETSAYLATSFKVTRRRVCQFPPFGHLNALLLRGGASARRLGTVS